MLCSTPCIFVQCSGCCTSSAGCPGRNPILSDRKPAGESTAEPWPDWRIIVGSVSLDLLLVMAKVAVAVLTILA